MNLVLSENVDYVNVKGDGFLLFLDSGQLENLNPSAMFILEGLQKGMAVKDIAAGLAAEFEGATAGETARDVDEFIRDLTDRKILLRKG